LNITAPLLRHLSPFPGTKTICLSNQWAPNGHEITEVLCVFGTHSSVLIRMGLTDTSHWRLRSFIAKVKYTIMHQQNGAEEFYLMKSRLDHTVL
jgi:hypothetical protein